MAEKLPAAAGGKERLGPLPRAGMLVATWLVPGLGHVLLRRRLHGAVFAVVILVCFVVGVAIGGRLAVPRPGDPLSFLAAIAALGNGVLYFLARAVGLGGGLVTDQAFEYGNTFVLTAGMMNLLLVLDVHDIMSGKKKW